jgi:predicted nucleic acid-binding protein
MPDGPVVCDTGPLIALTLIDQLQILHRLYPRVLVPRAVLDEVTAGGVNRPGASAIIGAEWLVALDDIAPDPLLAGELEASVIAAAYRLQARLAVLDERKARRIAARAYGLRVKGTAGILVAAKRAGLIAEVRPLLASMVGKGYFLSRRLIARAASEAGEETNTRS